MSNVRVTKEGNTWTVWVGSGIVRACFTKRAAENLVAKLLRNGF